MPLVKEVEQVDYERHYEFFNGRFYLDVAKTDSSKVVMVTGGADGMDSQTVEIKRAHTYIFNFESLFEVRVRQINYSDVEIQVCELSIPNTAKSIFHTSTIINATDTEETFSSDEARVMSSQLQALEKKLQELFDLSQEEKDYSRAAFDMLNKKLDKSSKSSWRQAAYGVVASVALSVSPDNIESASNFFDIAGTYLGSAANLMLKNS